MVMTATLVKQTSNWLRYLLAHDGEGDGSVTITSTGAATPDLQTDSIGAGPIRALSKARANGFAQFAAGALNQAQSRALWLSDWTSSPGNANTTTARCRITPRANADGAPFGAGGNWRIEANVDGEGFPTLVVSEDQLTGERQAYLDVEVPQAIGQGTFQNSLDPNAS